MDDLIRAIYDFIEDKKGRSDAGIRLAQDISDMTEKADIEKIAENKKHLNTIISNAVSMGQDDGFITGFKWAIKLLIDCLHEK